MQANPYGLDSLWLQGDIVIRGVAVLLLVLSVASWYVIVTKALQILRYRRASIVAGRQFWDASGVQEGVAALGNNNPFADLAKAGSPIVWGAPVISVLVLMTFAAVVLMAVGTKQDSSLVNVVLGTLGTMSTAVVTYWVGSSAGSAQKTALLARAQPIA